MPQVLAIDIGSNQICTLAAEYGDGKLEFVGAGISKAYGLKKGSIVNIDLASKSIKKSLLDAKRQSGLELNRAIVSISGALAKSRDGHGIVNVPTKEITIKEVNRAMHTAIYNSNIPNDYEILHALPYNFKIDEQELIQDPVGMSGTRLEVKVHIIIVPKTNLENLRRTVEFAGVEIENIVLSGYASAIATLNEDEKELGVCVIDIGGATCDTVIHIGNGIRFNSFLGVGGSNLTNDLSMALHTPSDVAEKIKLEYGTLHNYNDGILNVPVMGNENSNVEISLEVVSNVMYARVEETLTILARQIEKSGFKNQLSAGIVLTGGMSKTEGLREVASPIFDNMPIRISKPKPFDGLFESLKDPAFSTAFGLVRYGAGEYIIYEIDSTKNIRSRFGIQKNEQVFNENIIENLDKIEANQPNKIKEEKLDGILLDEDKKESSLGDFFTNLKHRVSKLF